MVIIDVERVGLNARDLRTGRERGANLLDKFRRQNPYVALLRCKERRVEREVGQRAVVFVVKQRGAAIFDVHANGHRKVASDDDALRQVFLVDA